ncbi:dephospho-CoA kinase [Bacillus lacus]|uniref:Dephospho-CoA kinase n=1 Tax=Metabacillus lacus TaxID=1983721 RepID=A0A7X2LWR6_9BACI|nr:dephospho-CoA kinase [Metabacillus lacus]MRX71765.1 dephospho-CoA kinase [Metabacillus lacus]
MTLFIGLTGGIASGKSTVSNMILELGIPVIDADKIAKEAVEPEEEAYKEIVRAFGNKVLKVDGNLDREKLGEIVFNSPEKRQLLNGIVHPAVRKEMNRQKDILISDGIQAGILDIPLLFESKLSHMVDKTLLVYADESVQFQRLKRRNGYSDEQAASRIASQLPLKDKISMADAVINNNGTIEDTKKQLLTILTQWKIKKPAE